LGPVGVHRGLEELEQLAQAVAPDVVQAHLPHFGDQGQALAQAQLDGVAAVAEEVEKRLHDAQQVGPVHPLPALERGRRGQGAVGLGLQALAPGQLGRELGQRLVVGGDGPALVAGSRGTGVTYADAPMVARGHQHEWEKPAGERLGLVAEALVDPATTLLAEEDAAAVLAVVEPIPPGPGGAMPREGFVAAEVLVAVPALFLDAAALLVRERNLVLLAAGAADVTVPVLQHRQVADR
jgi:hypothetical protein